MADWPYNTARWQRLRARKLAAVPLCEPCEDTGRITVANTVDHKHAVSQGGAPFPPLDELTSCCPPCHSAKTARGSEAGAVRSSKPRKGCDADGNSYDPAHNWNGGNGHLTLDAIERRMPSDLHPSRIPLTIVTGPPGAGKSTYVAERAGMRDRIICLDRIMSQITGQPEHRAAAWALRKALEARNVMLRKLATDGEHDRAWFIVSAAKPDERRTWAARLGGTLVLLDTQLHECVRRIRADPARAGQHDRMIVAATKWWEANPHLVRKSLRAAGGRTDHGDKDSISSSISCSDGDPVRPEEAGSGPIFLGGIIPDIRNRRG